MSTIHGNVNFTLNGVSSFNIGGDLYTWNSSWLGYVDVGSGDIGSTYTATVSLTGSAWSMSTLRFSGLANIKVVISDAAAGSNRNISSLQLSNAGGSTVNLTKTAVEVIRGGAGIDNITLGAGNCSTVDVGNGNDVVRTGTGSVGSIQTGAGNDTVNIGGGGADAVIVGQGTNKVTTSTGWVGSIFGYDGNDTVNVGAGGADAVRVGHGTNIVTTSSGWVGAIIAFNGNDTVNVGAAGAGAVQLGSGNNKVTTSMGWVSSIVAQDGDDSATLGSGGAGSIALLDGNDIYNLGAFSTTVIDTAGNADVITSTITRALGSFAAIERLTLLGTAAINGTGNGLGNLITGNAAANTLDGSLGNDGLSGGNGNDRLIGGLGLDTLIGGANNDTFVFNTVPNVSTNRDNIIDFNPAQDTIQLENTGVFTALTVTGALNPGFFRLGAAAVDANDHIVYNQATGALFYDLDGNAAGGAIQFAALSSKPALTSADLVVI